jgi:hypothetical protein
VEYFFVNFLASKDRKEKLFPFPTKIVGRRSHLFVVNDLGLCDQVLHRCRSCRIKASSIALNVALLTGQGAFDESGDPDGISKVKRYPARSVA